MKKKFIKFSRIIILASFFGLLLLFGAVYGQGEGIIQLPDVVFTGVTMLCLLVILCACICIVIAFFLSVIEWINTDKIGLLKRFASCFLIVGAIVFILKLTDKTVEMDMIDLLMNIIRMIPVVFSVDYIFINKKDKV